MKQGGSKKQKEARVWISTSIHVRETARVIPCSMCKKNVTEAALLYCLKERSIKPVLECYTCCPEEGNHIFLRYMSPEYKQLNALFCGSSNNTPMEEHASLFQHYNEHPRQLLQQLCPKETRRCSACNEMGAAFFCSTCERGVYCGKDCQTADWKAHKKVCAGKDPIFHIQTAKMVNCDAMRFKSNLIVCCDCVGDACTTRCTKCKTAMTKRTVELVFFRGFSMQEANCTQCGHKYSYYSGADMTQFVPFATTNEEFSNKLAAIRTDNGGPIWFKEANAK
jgi:hypothetical protein